MSRRIAILVAIVVALVASTADPAIATPREQQWYLDKMGVPQAQGTSDGSGTTIGMVFGYAPREHPDLNGQLLPGLYLDANGKRINKIQDTDVSGISTALAGFAVANGKGGLVGVAPKAKILAAVDKSYTLHQDTCIRWLADHGAKIILMAPLLEPDDTSPSFDENIRYALAKDVVVIITSDFAKLRAPARNVGLLVVGKVNRHGWRDEGGKENRADIVGPADYLDMVHAEGEPGKGDYSLTFPQEDLAAAALVAGAAALVRSKYPGMNAASVINRLLRTANDLGTAGVDDVYGHGMVNAYAAVTAEVPDVMVNPLGDLGPPKKPTGRDHSLALKIVLIVVIGVGVPVNVGLVAAAIVIRRRRGRREKMRSHPG